MKLNLDFVPHVIVYIQFRETGEHYFNEVWGDKNIFDYCKNLIISLMEKQTGFFCAQRGMGKYQIIPGFMDTNG